MHQRNLKRNIDGILLLDKPLGMSSNAALQVAKRSLAARKAGHTGSLDPLASGMLPLCFGEATKFSQYLLSADKTYQVTMRLGIRTATGDTEGAILSERPAKHFTQEEMEKIFNQFRGEIEQIPSMYSALKHQGQPLYKLARQGVTVARPSRRLMIYRLTLLSIETDTVQFELHCSKGTYVRTLVDDMGEALGCGAHVTVLRRISVGGFSQDMVTLEDLQADKADRYLLPIQSAVAHLPELILAENTAFYLRQGNPVVVPYAPASGWVRFADKQGRFLGVGEVLTDGKVAPRRLIHI